jgi:hypothetical protein
MRPVPIAGADGYFVSRDGHVFSTRTTQRHVSLATPTRMKHTINRGGYRQLNLRLRLSDGSRRTISVRVHKLVALAYIGPPPTPGSEVRHRNGDRSNNDADNLLWGSRADNAADMVAHGQSLRGEKHHSAKLSTTDVHRIRSMLRDGETQEHVAHTFGVSQVLISLIKRGRAWGWLSEKTA